MRAGCYLLIICMVSCCRMVPCCLCVVVSVISFACAFFFFFKQKTAYDRRISDWSSYVCSSDLRAGLTKSSSRLVDGISDAFRRRQLDEAALEELEEILIAADLGPVTAAKMTEALARSKFDKEVTDEEVRTALADEIAAVLEPVAQPIDLDPSLRPQIVLVVGVNGTGKTTTIGKLAKHLTADGQKVMLAAGDTFRAAAVEQLRIWGERAGCPVISRDTGADAAGLAYDAVEAARREGSDLLLIDTAGRLHNKDDLMAGIATIRTEEQTS